MSFYTPRSAWLGSIHRSSAEECSRNDRGDKRVNGRGNSTRAYQWIPVPGGPPEQDADCSESVKYVSSRYRRRGPTRPDHRRIV